VAAKAAMLQLDREQEKVVKRMEELVLTHGHLKGKARYKIRPKITLQFCLRFNATGEQVGTIC